MEDAPQEEDEEERPDAELVESCVTIGFLKHSSESCVGCDGCDGWKKTSSSFACLFFSMLSMANLNRLLSSNELSLGSWLEMQAR